MKPAYIELLQQEFPDRSESEIELMCSITRSLRKITGLSAHEHRKRGMIGLFPSRAWHDWRETRVASVQECLENRIQELMWMGSASCVAGETRIFNPLTGESPTIEELYERQEQPTVMTIFGPEVADVPFVKGVELLYEVTLESGASFTCTANHRLLTPDGYKELKQISPGDLVGGFEPCPLVSTLEHGLSIRERDEVRFRKTTASFRENCLPYCHRDDGRLPLDQEIARSSSPLPVDVRARREYAFCDEDGPEHKSRGSHLCLSSFLLSTSRTFPLFENRENLVRRLRVSKMNAHGVGQCLLRQRSHEGTFRSLPSEEPIPDSLHSEKLCNREHLEQIENSWGVRVSLSRVSAIRKTHERRFFDITVPRAAHYFAEGAIHHNSGKSGDMADIALTLWWSNPRAMTIYVASPFKEATENGIWAGIVEQFHEAKDNNRSLPGTMRTSQNAIVLDERAHPRSFIRLVTVDEVGKMKGKKAIDANSGNIIIIVDELPDFKDLAGSNFVKVLENLKSNQNLLIIGAGNFTSIGDSFARLTSPDEEDIPGGWYAFDPDRHHRWRTNRGGLALRFDGLQSPNIRAGRDIYPFLTRIEFVAKAAAAPGGLQSPDAMREVRSAPITSMEEYTVTNPERIRAGKAKEAFQWTGDLILKGGFCDFGLGGDPCVVIKFEVGWMVTSEGRKQVINFPEPPFVIPIQIGTEIPVQDQAALGLKAWAEGNSLPPENVGYDAAMRPGFAQRVGELYSTRARAIDSNGPATDRPINSSDRKPDGKPITWRDKVDRLVSEFWFVVASLIDSGQMRGLEKQTKAVDQFCTRRWEMAGKKKSMQTKLKYRELLRAMGRVLESPNEADAIAGCVEMARRLGLSVEAVAPNGSAASLLMDIMRKRDNNVRAVMPNGGTSLPTGRIHAMTYQSPLPAGKLNRRL